MLGNLTESQIEHVLHSEVIGRIGCFADGKVYVVPVTYAYDGKYIYLHTREGMKISMMRKNPNVCFEVDVMDNMANWRSVIIWGEYEELKDVHSQEKGMKILMDRLMPLMASETVKSSHHSMAPHIVEKGSKAIVYRIKITERSGRFEKQ
ncbi:MAG: pyridoxamine 5'-phosphate oxidase family protein [Cyclobacteriaceae bacterium]|nr:pyridoxamine 5'-phosphate oxidase family protein [Cyclobacteriaceae bacterium]